MNFSDTFCSSPWMHMRITNQGELSFCRHSKRPSSYKYNIRDNNIEDYFQNFISDIRNDILNGKALSSCEKCYLQDKHGKISGRKDQLLKIGVTTNNFNKSLVSSPWYDEFQHSAQSNGHTKLLPIDWQIDLGNYCNSACVFCDPTYSSRLALEFKKLGFIDTLPKTTWSNDPVLLEKFICTLEQTPGLKYLHFLGGETLVNPAFKTILKRLIKSKQTDATIGFTTNLTVWDKEIISLLEKFHNVNVGLSIETLHVVNDYLRYPIDTSKAKVLLEKWVGISKQHGWLVSIRTTPTVFSILHLNDLYDFAIENNIGIESCSFINEPAYMRPTILPNLYREQAIGNLQSWLDKHKSIKPTQEEIVNIRNPSTLKALLVQDIKVYIKYLQTEPDETHRLPQLVDYIKKLEKNRNNTILDYLPEYENLLRSAGY